MLWITSKLQSKIMNMKLFRKIGFCDMQHKEPWKLFPKHQGIFQSISA